MDWVIEVVAGDDKRFTSKQEVGVRESTSSGKGGVSGRFSGNGGVLRGGIVGKLTGNVVSIA